MTQLRSTAFTRDDILWSTVFILHWLNAVTWCPFSSQAIDSIHQVGLYCLALVPANTLPKTPLGGIHICETKQNFLEGNLHPCNILMCPHTCVTNLPKPRQKQPGTPPLHSRGGNCWNIICYHLICAAGVIALICLLICSVDVGPASMLVGNLVAGKRIAQATGRELGVVEDQDLIRKVPFATQTLNHTLTRLALLWIYCELLLYI